MEIRLRLLVAECRGDVCYLGQQPRGSPALLECSPGLPLVPGQGTSLTSTLFHYFNPPKLTPLLIG